MDENFNAIIGVLYQIHEDFPDLRFGEVVQNAIDRKLNINNVNLGDRGSKEILVALGDYQQYNEQVRNNGN